MLCGGRWQLYPGSRPDSHRYSGEIMKSVNEELVTDVYGYWPTFHDAEIHSVAMRRNLKIGGTPELYVSIHVWETTIEIDEKGYYRKVKHNIVRLGFENITDLELNGFNHQNVIHSLDIAETDKPDRGHYQVEFSTSHGAEMMFRCATIVVCSVRPY